jgi:hypothetical protein
MVLSFKLLSDSLKAQSCYVKLHLYKATDCDAALAQVDIGLGNVRNHASCRSMTPPSNTGDRPVDRAMSPEAWKSLVCCSIQSLIRNRKQGANMRSTRKPPSPYARIWRQLADWFLTVIGAQ